MAKDAAGLGQALGAIAADMTAALGANDAAAYRSRTRSSTNASSTAATTTISRGPTRVIAFRIQALRYRLAMDPALNAESLEQHHALARLIGLGRDAKAVALLRRHIAKTLDDYRTPLSPRPPPGEPADAAGDAGDSDRRSRDGLRRRPAHGPFVDSAKPRR